MTWRPDTISILVSLGKPDVTGSQRECKVLLLGSESRWDMLKAVEKLSPPSYQDRMLATSRDMATGDKTVHAAKLISFETRFKIGQLGIHLYDIGHLKDIKGNEQHCFEAVTSIIFVVDLDTYDQEDKMEECLLQFEAIAKSSWAARTSIILLLSRCGRFKERLRELPLGQFFPDYIGRSDLSKALRYMTWRI